MAVVDADLPRPSSRPGTVEEAFWLGTDRPCFAWYHGPAGAPSGLGVVLCKPLGYEMMCTHRAYRRLAIRLAARRFPVLRLDYDGAGDSSGSGSDPGRVEAWIASIGRGVQELSARGAKRVALVGVRFGALVAAQYAARRPVDALVLVSPPASGRAYLRELRALQAVRASAGDGGEEIAGNVLTAETVEHLAQLALVGDTAPARRVLLVARDDLDGREAAGAERLTRLGSRVTLSRTPGVAAMLSEDPIASVVPEALWNEVTEWLTSGDAADCGTPRPGRRTTAACVPSSASGPCLLEEIVDLDGLFGILSSPLQGGERSAPTVVLPNVGANHHVGCNRIYVEFARHWASLGLRVLRVDLPGIGDTPAHDGRPDNAVFSPACIDDVRRAMTWLARERGHRRFALGGICSGAFVCFQTALADDRVDCVMLVNPVKFRSRQRDALHVPAPSTFKSRHYYRAAALDLDTWIRAARGDIHVGAFARRMASRAFAWFVGMPSRWLGTDSDVEAGMRRLCNRGARVAIVCGDDDGARDVVDEHLGPDAEKLRGQGGFSLGIVPRTDHTFSSPAARRELFVHLTACLSSACRYPPSHPLPGADPRWLSVPR